MRRLQNWIQGEFRDPFEGHFISTVSPVDGEAWLECPDSSEMDIAQAVVGARKATKAWSRWDFEKRANFIERLTPALIEKRAEFVEAIVLSTGCIIAEAEREFENSLDACEFYLQAIKKEVAQTSTYLRPVGVAGLMTSCSYPLLNIIGKVVPAFLLGNSLVVKPSEKTPLPAYLLAKTLEHVGSELKLPAGVISFVFGYGEKVGATLCEHPAVPLISLTGRTETGEKVLAATSSFIKKLHLELGAKNSAIVFADVELDSTVQGCIEQAFARQGQTCLAASRIFVHQDIYEPFTEKFIEAVKNLKIGDPREKSTNIGPLMSREDLERMRAFVQRVPSERGKIAWGGEELEQEGYFIQPAVVVDLDRCSEINQEEVHGPFVTLLPFKYLHEVAEWASTVRFGHTAYLWTQDTERAVKAAAKFEVGRVVINGAKAELWKGSYGHKASALGSLSHDGVIEFFSESQQVIE